MAPELAPPTIVRDAQGLARLIEDLARQCEIAFDTEADSFFSYREKVCLMQITVEDRDYLVDPLAGLDVTPLGGVLADARKTKVFHDGEYDVLILKRAYGFEFGGLFDTRVAASALGEANPGLASVIKAHFGFEVDKSLQRSDWSARPLSERQIRYAQIDTHFLVALMHRQRAELDRRGRLQVVESECRRLELLTPADLGFDADDFARIKGMRALDRQAQQNLRELFALRDALARASDLPPFKVLSNQALMDLARAAPHSEREIARVPGLSARLARRHAADILEALARARELGPLKRLPAPRHAEGEAPSELEIELGERLKQWRKERAAKEGYDASLVLNRHVLARLAVAKPRTQSELAAIEGIADWQLATFGAEILDVIAASLAEFERDGLPRRGRRGFGRGRP
jgi:ribonuclease D